MLGSDIIHNASCVQSMQLYPPLHQDKVKVLRREILLDSVVIPCHGLGFLIAGSKTILNNKYPLENKVRTGKSGYFQTTYGRNFFSMGRPSLAFQYVRRFRSQFIPDSTLM